MSDFLFRMVERAAGLSATTTPRPPRELRWPFAEGPLAIAHDSAPRHPPVIPTESQVADSAAASISRAEVKESLLQSNRSNTVARPGGKEIAAPAVPFVPEESPWPAPFQSDYTNPVSAEAVEHSAMHSRVITPVAHRVLPRPGGEPELRQNNGENVWPVSDTQALNDEFDQEPLTKSFFTTEGAAHAEARRGASRLSNQERVGAVRPPVPPQNNGENVGRMSEAEALTDDFDQGPLTDTFFTMERAAKAEARSVALRLSNQERVGPVRPSISALAEVPTPLKKPTMESPTPRESVRAIAEPVWREETAEPPVEVKIGRVEIRFDNPVNPVPPPAPSRPTGFDEYAALRTYAVRPWSSRRR